MKRHPRPAASTRYIIRILAAVTATIPWLLFSPAGDSAAADGCPDIEVVFGRGTSEPPGVGGIGQSFIDALRWRVGPLRPLAVYPINYPASPDFATTFEGVTDASDHVRGTVAACPATAIVLGGFSRGAAVAGYTAAELPPEVADHVAAVILLGKPSNELLSSRGAPPIGIGPGYADKTIDLCAPGDPVCSTGGDDAAHGAYAVNGMTGQAADFVAERVSPPETVPGSPL